LRHSSWNGSLAEYIQIEQGEHAEDQVIFHFALWFQFYQNHTANLKVRADK